jgi:hypothetical protein
MWVAQNYTPFPVERAFLRDLQGGETWILVVRATFDVRPDGTLRKAAEQVPVCLAPSYFGKPGESSLRYDTDIVLPRPGTDVLLHGHAYAPGGRAAEMVQVAIKAVGWAKTLHVHGERLWQRHAGTGRLVASRGRPFVKLPLTYEKAWGGRDPGPQGERPPTCAAENPLGSGFAKNPLDLLGRPAPSIEDPRAPATPGPGPATPAGFGPLAPSWAPRVRFAGTYDDKWKNERAPLYPADFDPRFFRVAPADQQLPPTPAGVQRFELVNLTPSGRLKISLPTITIRARTIFSDGEVPSQGALHTVILEPDHPRVQLVWHMAVPCQGREQLLERSQIDWEGDAACLSP